MQKNIYKLRYSERFPHLDEWRFYFNNMSTKFIDLTGKRFKMLVVVKKLDNDNRNRIMWKCLCDCGRTHLVLGHSLRNGETKSCGCSSNKLMNETKTLIRGYSGHRKLIGVWENMKKRCADPKHISYKNYGARGISVCNEWLVFGNFIKWALVNGYREKLEIDRVNNDGNYCPENCEWVTKTQNLSHTRKTNNLIINGESKRVDDWAVLINSDNVVIYGWFKRGKEYTKLKFENRLNIEINEICRQKGNLI